jgi:hypothetical protein
MKSTFMQLPPLPLGRWWWNTAPLGQPPKWEMKVKPADVDPNKITHLFGYPVDEFMAKQYK